MFVLSRRILEKNKEFSLIIHYYLLLYLSIITSKNKINFLKNRVGITQIYLKNIRQVYLDKLTDRLLSTSPKTILSLVLVNFNVLGQIS